jgi:hypothetical protein
VLKKSTETKTSNPSNYKNNSSKPVKSDFANFFDFQQETSKTQKRVGKKRRMKES